MTVWEKVKAGAVIAFLAFLGIAYKKAKEDARKSKLQLKHNIANDKLNIVITKQKKLKETGDDLHEAYITAKAKYRAAGRELAADDASRG